MRIVIDTNVVMSAIMFGGNPEQLLTLLLRGTIEAVVSPEIAAEYKETLEYLCEKYPQRSLRHPLIHIISAMQMITPTTDVHICRDRDDDKFISCAIDGKCLYIVSGDKDLLTVGQYKDVEIVTVAEFLDRCINI